MVTSSVGPVDSSSYYNSDTAPASSASNTNASSVSGLPTRDTLDLQLDSSLFQSLSQPSSLVSSSAGYPVNIQQSVQNQEMIANPNLAQMLSQVTSSLTLPTNIQQAAQNQEILATDTGLAQKLTQQAASPTVMSMEAAMQTLASAGGSLAQIDTTLSPLVSWAQVMHEIATPVTPSSNPPTAQSLLQNYTSTANPASPGSIVDTSA